MSGSSGIRGTTPAIARRCSVLALIPSNSAASSSRRAMRSESGTGCRLSVMAAAVGHGADPCRGALSAQGDRLVGPGGPTKVRALRQAAGRLLATTSLDRILSATARSAGDKPDPA
jgi:hypothetical protein